MDRLRLPSYLGRLSESLGISILSGGILVWFTKAASRDISKGLMIIGMVFIVLSLFFGREATEIKELLHIGDMKLRKKLRSKVNSIKQ